MQRTTVEQVDSKAFRAMEVVLAIPLVLWGLVGVGVALAGTGFGPLASGGALMFVVAYGSLIAFGLLTLVTTPLLLYFDAKAIRSADLDWEPDLTLYALGGFLLGGLLKLYHLRKRHEHVVDWVESDRWWLPVAVGAFGTPLFVLAIAAMWYASLPVTLLLVPAGLVFVAAVVFPVGVYRDATYVRLNSGEWQPNPGTHLAVALTGLSLAPLAYPIHGAYYLYKRRQAL